MKIIKNHLPSDALALDFSHPFTEKDLFFDIETCGLSPKTAPVYLIGCLYFTKEGITTEQFLAENSSPQEEEALLLAFLERLRNFQRTITFNGDQFDISFLRERARRYGQVLFPLSICEEPKSGCTKAVTVPASLDLLKEVRKMNAYLKLPNYRQKTIEEFLGIDREDRFSGGELIDVFLEYAKNADPKLEHLLLIHNYEDLLGMPKLSAILTYPQFLKDGFFVSGAKVCDYTSYDGKIQKELLLSLEHRQPLPKGLSFCMDDIYAQLGTDRSSVRIPIHQGELKHFYANYKDYYYLPEEDMAMHKSVAAYVDKNYRKPAKACNCYTRKTGFFLPQHGPWVTPFFLKDYKDTLSFFEFREEILTDNNFLTDYLHRFFLELIK